jgi:hypothetical protein
MSIDAAMKDRVVRLLGRALIDIGWDRPRSAADLVTEALVHLKQMADRDTRPKAE